MVMSPLLITYLVVRSVKRKDVRTGRPELRSGVTQTVTVAKHDSTGLPSLCARNTGLIRHVIIEMNVKLQNTGILLCIHWEIDTAFETFFF